MKDKSLRRRVNGEIAAADLVHGTGAKEMRDTPVRQAAAGESYLGIYRQGYKTHGGKIMPPEIEVSDDPESLLTAAHEVGHMIDHDGLPGPGYSSSRLDSASEKLRAVFEALRATATVASIQDEVDNSDPGSDWHRKMRYLGSADELWARAYAQWVAWKSGDRQMKADLDHGLRHKRAFTRLKFWPHDEFLPVAYAMDRLFEHLGWLKRQ